MQRWMQSAAGGTSQRLKPGFGDDAFPVEKSRRGADKPASLFDRRHGVFPWLARLAWCVPLFGFGFSMFPFRAIAWPAADPPLQSSTVKN